MAGAAPDWYASSIVATAKDLRSDRDLAVLPAAALHLPRHPPGDRAGDRREGHRLLRDLPDPRRRPPGPHPTRLAGPGLGLLRHRRCQVRRYRGPSTGSSRRPEGSGTATATSPTTGSECSWSRTANAPTAVPALQSHDHHPKRRKALKSRARNGGGQSRSSTTPTPTPWTRRNETHARSRTLKGLHNPCPRPAAGPVCYQL